MSWTRLVLKDKESREQLEIHAARSRWYIDEVVQATDNRPFELVYVDERHDAVISYIEDEKLGLTLAFVRGENHALVAELIREKVSVVTHDFVMNAANGAKTSMDHVKAVYLAAGTARSAFDKDLFDVIVQAAHHDDASVRHAALLAVAYVQWRECRTLLQELTEDKDDAVQQAARSMLAAWPDAA